MIHHQIKNKIFIKKKKKNCLEIARPISDLSHNYTRTHTHTHTLQAPCNSVRGGRRKSHSKLVGESSHPSPSPQDSSDAP